jgi:hypothetical protein
MNFKSGRNTPEITKQCNLSAPPSPKATSKACKSAISYSSYRPIKRPIRKTQETKVLNVSKLIYKYRGYNSSIYSKHLGSLVLVVSQTHDQVLLRHPSKLGLVHVTSGKETEDTPDHDSGFRSSWSKFRLELSNTKINPYKMLLLRN